MSHRARCNDRSSIGGDFCRLRRQTALRFYAVNGRSAGGPASAPVTSLVRQAVTKLREATRQTGNGRSLARSDRCHGAYGASYLADRGQGRASALRRECVLAQALAVRAASVTKFFAGGQEYRHSISSEEPATARKQIRLRRRSLVLRDRFLHGECRRFEPVSTHHINQ